MKVFLNLKREQLLTFYGVVIYRNVTRHFRVRFLQWAGANTRLQELTKHYSNFSEVEMNFILWIIFGAIAGWIASIIMGRNAQMGALANIVVGIVGALIGGFIMNAFGAQGVSGFNLTSLIVAILGAIVLLFLVGLVRRT